jgi:hypothetical protein
MDKELGRNERRDTQDAPNDQGIKAPAAPPRAEERAIGMEMNP